MGRHQKSIFRFIHLLIMTTWLVAGCIPSPAVAPPAESTAPAETATVPVMPGIPTVPSTQSACPGGVVTLTLDDWSNTEEAIAARTEVLTAFEAAHPCIKVQIVDQTTEDADAQRLQAIQSGTASDLIAVESSYIPAYSDAGGLADLTPFIQVDPDFNPTEMFFQGVWRAGFYKDQPRAIAKDFSTCATYINVGLFEKAGLPIPQEGWTYDEYIQIAQKLTLDKNGHDATSPDFDPQNIVQYGATNPYWAGDKGWFRGFENLLYSFGAHALNPEATATLGYLDSPAAVRAWEFSRDMVHKHHVAPDATVLSAQEDGNMSLFKAGKLAMVAHWGPWFYETLNDVPGLNWAVVPLPGGPAGHRGVIMWMGWGLNAKTAHPQEAWELLKWLTTEPGQRVFTRRALTQYKPLAIEFQRVNDPFWGVFLAETEFLAAIDDAANSRFFPCVSNGPAAEFLYRIWQPGSEQIDIQAELTRLAIQADQCLAQAP